MDLKTEALFEIAVTRKFFDKTTACLSEEDSAFRPHPETMSVAQQVAHAADTIDWFRAGAFDNRWDMDFEAGKARAAAVSSLTTARAQMAAAWERMREAVEAVGNERLAETLADNPILPGRPLYHVVEALVDHTGHHRGALAVYARLLGKTPEVPYAD